MLLDIKVVNDIQHELEGFFDGLNWTFIFIYVITLFGIKNKPEFYWYNNIMNNHKKLKPFKVWIAGLTVGLIFCLFHYLENKSLQAVYVSQMLRSWLIVVVFNSVFVEKANQIEKKFIEHEKKD